MRLMAAEETEEDEFGPLCPHRTDRGTEVSAHGLWCLLMFASPWRGGLNARGGLSRLAGLEGAMLLTLALIAGALLLVTTIFPALIVIILTFAIWALAAYAVFWFFGLFVPAWLLLVLCFLAWLFLFRSKGRS